MSAQRRTAPMVLTPTSEVVAFLVHAIREHEARYRRNGAVVPTGVAELVVAMSFGVTQGQAGSPSAATLQTEQIEVMKPRLVRYETAAQLLDISVSSLKRQIRDGALHPISIGGASRIRVSELDEFVAAPASAQEGTG